MIFHPEKLPENYKFTFPVKFEERYFRTRREILLNAVHFKVPNPKGVVMYFHGNKGSIAGWGLVYPDFIERNYDLIMYDYRGFGKSKGRIINAIALLKDALFITSKIRNEYQGKKIIYYGRSLGSGIAAYVASKKQPDALVLATPYFNFQDVVKHYYPFIPTKLILKYRLKTDKWIKLLDCPIFLIHGTKDELIPFESSIRLQKIKPEADLTTIIGANHSTYVDFDDYQKVLDRILGPKIKLNAK